MKLEKDTSRKIVKIKISTVLKHSKKVITSEAPAFCNDASYCDGYTVEYDNASEKEAKTCVIRCIVNIANISKFKKKITDLRLEYVKDDEDHYKVVF